MKLENAVAIITGASSDIGQAVATAFARKKASVVLHCYRRKTDAEMLVNVLKEE